MELFYETIGQYRSSLYETARGLLRSRNNQAKRAVAQEMRVLAVVPGTRWKREDVRREYGRLAKRMGPPRFLLTDGAVELRESADTLETPGKKLTLLRDPAWPV